MSKRISKLKRCLCIVGIVALSFAVAPSMMIEEVNAATCPSSEGPTNLNELQQKIQNRQTNIKLCGNINGTINIPSTHNTYAFSIDLNGNNVSNGITVTQGTPSSLTISDGAGGGKVSGAISASTRRLTITGGTFTSNPSSYVKATTLKAYQVGNEWKVETKLTEQNVTVSPTDVEVKKGDSAAALSVSLPSGSTSSYTFASEGTATATVDDAGVITGVAVGTTTVKVTPTYDTTIVKTVNVTVLPNLESVDADDVVVMSGKTSTIVPTYIDSSVSPVTFTFTSNNENVATVDEDGVVTGVAVGTTTIKITATYDGKTVETTINVSVFDVESGVGDEDDVASGTVRNVIDEGLPENMEDASDHQKEVFGPEYVSTGDALKDAMKSGAVISTGVNFKDSTNEAAMAKIDEALKNVKISNIRYYDVTVGLMQNGDQFGLLHKLDGKLTFAIAKVEKPADGLERQYYLVAYHEGDETATILVEGEDYEIIDGVIYVMSDRFSTFAVAYVDTLVPSKGTKAPDTGKETIAKSSASSANLSAMITTLIAMTVLAGVAVRVNRK